MRITVEVTDDMIARVERLRGDRSEPLEAWIVELVRVGLGELEERQARSRPFVQPTVSVDGVRIADLDDIGEVLETLEGDEE